jgi:hypothetical protein
MEAAPAEPEWAASWQRDRREFYALRRRQWRTGVRGGCYWPLAAGLLSAANPRGGSWLSGRHNDLAALRTLASPGRRAEP